MRRITAGMDSEKRNQSQQKNGSKNQSPTWKACGKKGHSQRDCRDSEKTCNYCKGTGHWKADCSRLKRKDRTSTAPTTSPTAKATQPAQTTAATVSEAPKESECKDKLHLQGPIIRIVNINKIECALNALIDTGPPSGFVYRA